MKFGGFPESSVVGRLAKYGCKEHCHISGHLLLARHKTTALKWDSMTFLWISSISPRLWETLRYSERFWRTLSSPLVGLYDVSMMFPWCFHDVYMMLLWVYDIFWCFCSSCSWIVADRSALHPPWTGSTPWSLSELNITTPWCQCLSSRSVAMLVAPCALEEGPCWVVWKIWAPKFHGSDLFILILPC